MTRYGASDRLLVYRSDLECSTVHLDTGHGATCVEQHTQHVGCPRGLSISFARIYNKRSRRGSPPCIYDPSEPRPRRRNAVSEASRNEKLCELLNRLYDMFIRIVLLHINDFVMFVLEL